MLQDASRSAASASGVTFEVGTGAYAATFRLRLTDTAGDPFLLPELRTFACPGKL
jgi:hypothetical protein